MTAINTTYQFVTDGDFINFLINDNLACTLSKDSNAVQWYFDNDLGIRFCVRGGTYFTRQPEDISFDGTPLTTKEGFVTAIKAMFPVYAGGSGSTPGINEVLSVQGNADGNDLTNLRILQIAQDGKIILISPNGTGYTVTVSDLGVLVVTPES